MQEAQLRLLSLRQLDAHLDMSAVAEDVPRSSAGASVSSICGYTEWVSDSAPVVSVGWDWMASATGLLAVIPKSIRTNLMLIDAAGNDLGHAQTTEAIQRVLSQRPWQASVLAKL